MNSTEFHFMIEFIFMSLPSGSSLKGPEIYCLPSHVLQFAINKLKIKNIRQTQVIIKASSSIGQTTIFHKTQVGRPMGTDQSKPGVQELSAYPQRDPLGVNPLLRKPSILDDFGNNNSTGVSKAITNSSSIYHKMVGINHQNSSLYG